MINNFIIYKKTFNFIDCRISIIIYQIVVCFIYCKSSFYIVNMTIVIN